MNRALQNKSFCILVALNKEFVLRIHQAKFSIIASLEKKIIKNIIQLVPSSSSTEKVTPDLQRKMGELCDLIEKCTVLDPSRRASINDCLSHSFIVEKIT